MGNYITNVQLRWADLDPNGHPRHSVYYDWGAMCRVEFLHAHGLTVSRMQELHFGPILFREECVFRKEIRVGDMVTMDLELKKAKRDYSRWTIQHSIVKNGSVQSAILTVDGAWLNTESRKLATPPADVIRVFSEMGHHADFQWMD